MIVCKIGLAAERSLLHVMLTLIRSRTRASARMVGLSFTRSEIAVNRGPRPAAARSPVSSKFRRPVRGSIVMITTSSAHKLVRSAKFPSVNELSQHYVPYERGDVRLTFGH